MVVSLPYPPNITHIKIKLILKIDILMWKSMRPHIMINLQMKVLYLESIDNVCSTLKNLRSKNTKGLILGYLNINSVRNKFEFLKPVANSFDMLTIVETKIDDSFPTSQFMIEGFMRPFRHDRNKNGGGLLIYARDGAPIKQLNSYNFPDDIEAIIIEINLKKQKWLVSHFGQATQQVGKSDSDIIVVHAGTNDIKSSNAEALSDEIINTLSKIQESNPSSQIAYSSMFRRNDKNDLTPNRKVAEVNKILEEKLNLHGFDFINNANILFCNLWKDGLNINAGGIRKFAGNLSSYFRYC